MFNPLAIKMTEQQRIQEGIASLIIHLYGGHEDIRGTSDLYDETQQKALLSARSKAREIMKYEASQGVVLKVAEISEDLAQTAAQFPTYFAPGVGMSWERDFNLFKQLKAANYVATRPLIEEKK